jgi:hypothetical protein
MQSLSKPPEDYRALCRLAVVSVVLGAFSVLTAFHWSFLVLPLAALISGWRAIKRINALPEQLTGRTVAWVGIGLASGMWLFGGVCWAVSQMREVPPGYRLITFDDLQPNPNVVGEIFPPAILKLEGEKVFLRGYIYPGQQMFGIKEFILVPTLGHCSFCTRELRSTEMVLVRMQGDLRARYAPRLTRVGGRMRLDREAARARYGSIPYIIDADYIR